MEDPAPEPRGRKHPLGDDDQHATAGAKRSGSAESAYSSSSVSTVSTALSRSRSPRARDEYMTSQNLHMSGATLLGETPPLPPPPASPRRPAKRRRDESEDESEDEAEGSSDLERNTRRRHNASSPHERGRAPERTRGGGNHGREDDRGGDGRREPLPRSPSPSPPAARRRSGDERGSRSRSRSPYRARRRDGERGAGGERGRGFDGRRGGGRESPPPSQQQRFPRKRSMSPYSKRLALTQAMGRP